MLVEGATFFLGVSILLYVLFAGADFGGGILEAFRGRRLREEQKALITHAISPVWEANHVWLILALVILFVAFPRAYAQISITFHIPLTLMLLGIVLRGCAFTFRHYDAVQDGSQRWYSALFVVSSFVTPFLIGTIAGAIFLARAPGPDFVGAYVSPWCNGFSFSVGLFTCALFAYLAAVYLLGETAPGELRRVIRRRAYASAAVAFVFGGLVFAAGGPPLIVRFLTDPVALFVMAAATFSFLPLWFTLERPQVARVIVAGQVGLILLGWFELQFPRLVGELTIHAAAAPDAVLRPLLGALVVGCALIFPALIYLMRIFKVVPR